MHRLPRTRSLVTTGLLLLVTVALLPSDCLAYGLYHGRHRARDAEDWTLRLNVGGGLHTATDPWNDVPGTTDDFDPLDQVGGYLTGGLEFRLGSRNSLELYGSWRDLDDTEDFYEVSSDAFGVYRYSLESQSAGLTLRQLFGGHASSTYWGVGGGIVRARARYRERVGGSIGPLADEEDTAGEAHVLAGWDGRLAPSLLFGIELGFRYTWLEYAAPDLADTGDFTGFFAGLRLGILLGR